MLWAKGGMSGLLPLLRDAAIVPETPCRGSILQQAHGKSPGTATARWRCDSSQSSSVISATEPRGNLEEEKEKRQPPASLVKQRVCLTTDESCAGWGAEEALRGARWHRCLSAALSQREANHRGQEPPTPLYKLTASSTGLESCTQTQHSQPGCSSCTGAHSSPPKRSYTAERQRSRNQPLTLGTAITCCCKGLTNKVTCIKALVSHWRCCGELKYWVKQLRKGWTSPGRSSGGAPRTAPYCPSTAWPGFPCLDRLLGKIWHLQGIP